VERERRWRFDCHSYVWMIAWRGYMGILETHCSRA
jgi:hypothetical protein